MTELNSRDPYDLNRFIKAQEHNYHAALAELQAGKKRTHWSWYIFPQVQGLGISEMSVRYAISGLPEAKAYLEHPVLGTRLIETIAALLTHDTLSAAQILGHVDAQKLRSCLTLFNLITNQNSLFKVALDKYFSGVQDQATLDIITVQKKQN